MKCLTNPLWPEQFKRDSGGAETPGLGGDDYLPLVVFGRPHAAHYLAGRHPLCCQQAVMAADRQTWEGRAEGKRWTGWEIQPQCDSTNKHRVAPTHTQTIWNKRSSLRQNWRLSASLVKLSPGGQSSSWGQGGCGWPWPSFLSLSCFKLTCVTSALSGPLLAQCALCPSHLSCSF